MPTPGRNDPCPCGSGKKYKRCCMAKDQEARVLEMGWLRMRRTADELVDKLVKHFDRHYGPAVIGEAWDEYTVWSDLPMDDDVTPELETSFLPWLLYNWEPDNAETERAVDLPEISVARHYLEQKGVYLDSYQQRLIEEACEQQYSFFMVTDTVPGKHLLLRDLLLKEDVTVHEQQASATLSKGQILFTRIITLDSDSIMLGCAPIVITPDRFDVIVEFRERLMQHRSEITRETLHDFDLEMREIYFALREQRMNPAPPRIRNTDGDETQMTKISYKLGCTVRAAVDALFPLSMEDDLAALLEVGEFDDDGELAAIEFPWLKAGNKQHKTWDNTVMGHITIEGDSLTVEVNSQERSEAIQAELQNRLGDDAVLEYVTIDSLEDMMAKAAERRSTAHPTLDEQQHEDLMAMPEIQERLREMAANHWSTWPDIPLPALGDKTPREAAQTDLGRERLEALLFEFEDRNSVAGAFRPDVAALRKELGLVLK